MCGAGGASLLGIALAYALYRRRGALAARLARLPGLARIESCLCSGWGFDWLYERVCVRPFIRLAALVRGDAIDRVFAGIALLNVGCHRALSRAQSGKIRWYIAGLGLGAAATMGIVLLL